MLRRNRRFAEGALVVACVLGSWSSTAFAFRGGPPAGANGSTASFGNTCRACHGIAVGAGSVQILNVPATYSPNTIYNISVRVADPAKLGAGFQLSIEDGTGTHQGTFILSPAESALMQHNSGWLNHRLAGVNDSVSDWAANGNSYTYTMSWQAPASDVGMLTFWAAGNAINNNFSSSGDVIYLTNTTISFSPGLGPCCNDATGECQNGVTQSACESGGGRFGGAGFTCGNMTPPCLTPTGACCVDATGQCEEDLTPMGCSSMSGRWGGAGSTCATIDPPCLVPGTGACCRENGACLETVLQADCEAEGSRYGGEGSTCADIDPPCETPVSISLTPLVTGLSSPVDLTHAGDGSGRIFIVDQVGQIRVVDAGGNLLATPFLDISTKIPPPNAFFDERGLLGLAFHPNYETNGRFFIRYSAPRTGAPEEPCNDPEGFIVGCHSEILAEYHVLGDPATSNVADPNSEIILYSADKPQFNHNSGQVAFGPDGYLYFTLGDGGGAHDGLADGDPPGSAPSHGPIGNGQNRFAQLGKMHRIDVDSAPEPPYPFAIPDDNPFADGVDGLPEIYAYGLRNPFKFSFDDGPGGSGALILPDVGQNLYEEVNMGALGANYGWVIREAAHCFDPLNPVSPPASCPTTGALGEPLVDPVMEYLHSVPCTTDTDCAPLGVGCDEVAGQCENEGGISIIGGYVYHGAAVPGLCGKYVFGDFSNAFGAPGGRLYYMDLAGPNTFVRKQFFLSPDNPPLGQFLKGFGEDQNGELYALVSTQLGPLGGAGSVLRIDHPFAAAPGAEPGGVNKSRYVSFTIPPTLVAGDVETAIRINMISLHHVDPPYPNVPPTPFTAFEGMHVWLGPPLTLTESSGNPVVWYGAYSQCTPHYFDWSALPVVHIGGAHITPSSKYRLESVPRVCEGQEDTNPDCQSGGSLVSSQFEIDTTRWADVEIPFNPPSATAQPDIGDVSALVNKFRSAPGAIIKARALLSGYDVFGQINPVPDIGFSHIASTVDSYRGQPYPFKMGKCATGPTRACTTDADCTGSAQPPCNLFCP